MTVNNIIEKILQNAQLKAEQVEKDSQHDIDQMKVEIFEEYTARKEKLEKTTTDKIARAVKKARVLAQMEGRNKLLAKKREIIEEVFQETLRKLSSLSAKDYEQLLAQMMKGIQLEEGTVYPSEGKENSTKGAIKLAGKSFKVGASKKIAGGFLFESETADVDASFETLIYNVLKNDLEHKIATQIF